MPAKDVYHDSVVNALIKDGWTITDDPLRLTFGGQNFYVDLGAEQPIAAKKGGRKIAVEIKSFLSDSPMRDLELALGQYQLYEMILDQNEPDRKLYLAISQRTYDDIFKYPIGLLVLENQRLNLLVFDEKQERMVKWIP